MRRSQVITNFLEIHGKVKFFGSDFIDVMHTNFISIGLEPSTIEVVHEIHGYTFDPLSFGHPLHYPGGAILFTSRNVQSSIELKNSLMIPKMLKFKHFW